MSDDKPDYRPRPRAADDYEHIGERLKELRREREQTKPAETAGELTDWA